MKKATLVLFLFFACFAKGQVPEFCNITHGDNSFLINNPPDVLTGNGSFTVRIFVHVITDLHGNGGMSAAEVDNSLKILNDDFLPHNICFSLLGKDEIHYNLTTLTDVPGIYFDITSGAPLFNLHANAIDIFLAPDDTKSANGLTFGTPGPTGLEPPGSWFIIGGTFPKNYYANLATEFVLTQTHAISHEMGHCLGLFHTDHGSNCEMFPGITCPEFANQTNCGSCGDYVCDTWADPCLGPAWISPDYNTCIYSSTYLDPNNQVYNPLLHNIMSHTSLNCMQSFTSGQGERMRYFLATHPLLIPREVPNDIFIQDKTFNSGTTLYAASTSITSGYNVSTSFPFGYVNINLTSNLEFKSHNYLSLEPGFIAKPNNGGSFYSHIDPSFCSIINQNNSARTTTLSYYPFLDQPKWFTVNMDPIDGTRVRKIEEVGDSVINGTTYSILYSSAINLQGIPNTYPFYFDTGNIYLREDTLLKRVYWLNQFTGVETLYYNFDLPLGSSLPTWPSFILTTIDSQLTTLGYRKRLIFNQTSGYQVIWLEGVGNIGDPLNPAFTYTVPGHVLICFYQNDSLVYDAGALYNFNCTTLSTAINEQNGDALLPLNVYPNPFNNTFTVALNLYKDESVNVLLYDASGRVIDMLSNNQNLPIGRHEISYSKKLMPGVYLVKLVTDDGIYTKKIFKVE